MTWEQVRIGSFAKVHHGWPFRSDDYAPPALAQDLPRVVSIGNFAYSGGFTGEFKGYKGSYPPEYELEPNDLLLVMTCQTSEGEILGLPARVPSDGLTYLHNQRIGKLVVHEPTTFLPSFLYYVALTADLNRQLFLTATGTKILHTSPGRIEDAVVPCPPIRVQHAIAQVLGALDDKIAANARVGKAADSYARMTVDGLAGSDARAVGAIVENHRVPSSPPFTAGAYVGLEHVPRRHMWMADSGEARGLASGKFQFEPGDVLFGKLRPYFHKVVVADRSGVCSTDILVLRSRNPDVRGLVWGVLASDAVVERVSAMTEGTRMPRTNWADLAACEVPWPSDERARELSRLIETLGERASAAQTESRKLAELRDTLLPHLMSGRISVRQAESVVSEAL